MSFGAFSVSLNVKNIVQSKEFYEKLGFKVFHGDEDENWLIMKNDDCTIGLFQGMFEKNIMTFNPGWDNNAQPITSFKDIREIQEDFKKNGITIVDEVDLDTKGPGSFMIEDPDGNPILIDQHV